MESSGPIYSSEGIYRSTRPKLSFPDDPLLSLTAYLFRNSASYPNRLAIAEADSNETLTFSQLRSAVRSSSAGLRRIGIGKGSVVLIFASNSIDFVISFFAITAAGAVSTTANPLYTVSELSKQAKDSGAELVLTDPHLWHKVKSLHLPTIFFGPKPNPSSSTAAPIRCFADLKLVPESEYVPTEIRQSDIAAILYSSGTTGANKGVMLTHRNFICTSIMVSCDQDLLEEPPNTYLCFLPLFHVFGLSVITFGQLQRGNSLVLMSKFEMEAMLSSIERFRVTHLPVVPPIMIGLVKQGKVTKYDLSSLVFIVSGAAPLGKDVSEEVAGVFPRASINQGYGLTESCGIVSLQYSLGKAVQYGSTGHLCAGVEGKVISIDTEKPLPPNGLGELCFRGPNIMQGYFKNLEATKSTIDSDGWLHTGDLGYFDETGSLFVVDRIKELIKYKGFQVAPAELEGLLLSHPEILDGAVIPLADEEAGEVPIAYIVRSAGSSLTELEVQKFIADQVAPFKRLRRVTFVDSIPKSASGKILRREFIQMVRSSL